MSFVAIYEDGWMAKYVNVFRTVLRERFGFFPRSCDGWDEDCSDGMVASLGERPTSPVQSETTTNP